MRVPRVVRTVPMLLVAALALPAVAGPASAVDWLHELATSRLSPIAGELTAAGLDQPVEVSRDRWGVAHIRARGLEDLFFAQGYVAAQDRLWQMEWWRRFGEGSLAEILGPDAVPHDRFARLLRYRGDLDEEYRSYHPEGRRIIESFTAGVNAWIAETADRLPVEFELTGIEPRPWTPEVPILRMAGLAMTGNNLDELALARSVHEHGVQEANRRDEPDPWQDLRVPAGLDLSLIPDDWSERTVGRRPVAPALLPRYRERLREAAGVVPGGNAVSSVLALAAEHDRRTFRAPWDGSNNWVIDGSRSATGLPLMANDPHRSLALPSLRYLVHLQAPGWNVIGSGEPALPGVAIGHNERVGWGLTIVGIDQGDVFVERLHPDDDDLYWHEGGWERFASEVETLRVKGEPDRELLLEFSHHGPVIYKDLENRRAWSFRTVLTEPGTAGYLGSLRLDQAENWDDFVEAMRGWKVPSENMIYGDVDGNIGWLAAGLTPERDGWVGRLPVPGDGSHEWQGFRDTLDLPWEYNPERGFIATANHNVMPEGYEPPLGYSWASPARYERIREVLQAGDSFTVADFQRLQLEVYSATAARRVSQLGGWRFGEPTLDQKRAWLAGWDARLEASSARALLYKIWEAQVEGRGGFEDLGPEVAEEALGAALAELEESFGADPAGWRWGLRNRMTFAHPLVEAFDAGEVERPGDRTTVNIGHPRHGASFREILDFANWDRSLATSVPGQSGQPGSAHYGDLLPLWERGEYFPLAYSDAAVEAVTVNRMLLRPAPEGR